MARRICRIDGCNRFVKGQDLCNKHHLRLLRHGSPEPPGFRERITDDDERLWSHIDKTHSCWLWCGPISTNGYGNVRRDGRFRLVHRLVYELVVGAIPAGLQLDHLCRVRRCCNPDHLEPVTQAENIRRGINATSEFCKRGHRYDGYRVRTSRGTTSRRCRECQKEAQRRKYRKRRARDMGAA